METVNVVMKLSGTLAEKVNAQRKTLGCPTSAIVRVSLAEYFGLGNSRNKTK